MVQLELFSLQALRTLSVSNSPSVSDPPSPDAQVHANKWKYFEWMCSISEKKIYQLLERFEKDKKHETGIKRYFPPEEIKEIARTAVVDLMYRYQYGFISPLLVEKYTINVLKRYLRSERPFIIHQLPENLSNLLGL